MTLPKKKSHPITVDGIMYRWCFSEKLDLETNKHRLNVTVERAADPASKLLARGECETTSPCLDPAVFILPRHVATMIKDALAKGWNPEKPGADFVLRNLEQFVQPND
jgi:hypothetical protein